MDGGVIAYGDGSRRPVLSRAELEAECRSILETFVRTCLNCVRYCPLDQWIGHREEHDQGTEPEDTCERWDGR